MIAETIGTIGAIAFAICGLPQAIKCYRTKRADDMSWLFLILWAVGEVCMIAYTVMALDSNRLLLANYLANGAFLAVIIYYKRPLNRS
jgi:uncharacterized protein with PQ loop repeat